MREHKYKFYYKNKLIETFTLKEIAERCNYHWADDVKVVKYTGFLDKKGVEIYEFDLIRATKFAKKPEPRIVKYDVERGSYFLTNNSLSKNKWETCLSKRYLETFEYEKIGSVYENPELLK